MRKVSHKFSFEGLSALMQLAVASSRRLEYSTIDEDRLLYCCLIKIQFRLSRLLMFRFDNKRLTFSLEEFIVLRLAYTKTKAQWGTYEEVVINTFLSEGGKKL